MIVQRVEKHLIKKSNNYYEMLDGFCFAAKNLYNHANYIVRNEFCKNNRWIRSQELDKILRPDEEYPDYRNMPTAQSAQQILKVLDINWRIFFKTIKDWAKHKEKYLGKPRLPKYKDKNSRQILILTNQEARFRNGKISFPKTFKGFELYPVCVLKNNFVDMSVKDRI